MTVLNPSDFYLKVARGDIAGHTVYNRFGINEDVDTAASEDLIEQGGTITFPTTAESLEVVSGNAADDSLAAGTGAREITLEGLDASFNLQTTAVTTNGVTPVAVTGTWRRVFRASVSDSGTSQGNVGQITVRVSGGGATRLIIAAAKGQTNFLCHSVPVGHTLFVPHYMFGVNAGGGTARCTFQLVARHEINDATHRGIVRVKNRTVVEEGVEHDSDFKPYFKLAGPADVWVTCTTTANNTSVYGEMDLIVVED